MDKKVIYSLKSLYREDMNIYGYTFGAGEKSACIVGPIRGNEIQQLYVCSRLVRALTALEKHGAIIPGKEILVIPSVNHYSMNIGKRFWPIDNTDINRMFPGYDKGETTQRVAAGVFDVVKEYEYGIQFASFYMPGDFIPHVRMMETGYHNPSLANLFGLPYVVIRKPKPVDTTTLNYNWQIWETNAFSLYTNATDQIDEESANQAVTAVLRFLARMGLIRYNCHGGYIASVLYEQEMEVIRSEAAGIYRPLKKPGDSVHFGEKIAEIIHPFEGTEVGEILSSTDGVVFFSHVKPLVMENEVVYKLIRRIHI